VKGGQAIEWCQIEGPSLTLGGVIGVFGEETNPCWGGGGWGVQ